MFTVTELLDGRWLIEGTDATGVEGRAIFTSPKWHEVKDTEKGLIAQATFEDEVLEFFKPLTDAAEALEQEVNGAKPWTSITLQTGVEAVDEITVELDAHGRVLYMIECWGERAQSNLRWIGDELVVVAP